MRRVAITGIGLVTGLGVGTQATWDGLLAGRTAVDRIRGFDASSLRTQLGAEIRDFEPRAFASNRRLLRMMTRSDQLALAGATLAVRDAGLDPAAWDGDRAGLYVGGAKSLPNPEYLLDAILAGRAEDGSTDMRQFGQAAQTAYPLFYIEGLQGSSLFYISEAFGLRGANAYFHGSSDAGATALGTAYRAVRRGECDMAIAGAADDAVSLWNMCSLDGLGLTTTRNELGPAACRPYDLGRDGTVLGEGAAFLVLEELHAARRRGAWIYAELDGCGSAFDAYALLTPHPDGRGPALAMRAALREASAPPASVDYVATHGSGTRLGDATEARALRDVFGAAADRLVASSVKPAVGHLSAAAGAVSVAVAALALAHAAVPPTLNLDTPDPDCDLDWVPRQARQLRARRALAVARGVEGQAVVLSLRAASELGAA